RRASRPSLPENQRTRVGIVAGPPALAPLVAWKLPRQRPAARLRRFAADSSGYDPVPQERPDPLLNRDVHRGAHRAATSVPVDRSLPPEAADQVKNSADGPGV